MERTLEFPSIIFQTIFYTIQNNLWCKLKAWICGPRNYRYWATYVKL